MVFLHAALLEHLMFRCAPRLLCTKQLQQAGMRVPFTCSALAAGLECLVCLCPCKRGSRLHFPLHPSSAALCSSQLKSCSHYSPFPAAPQGQRALVRRRGPWGPGRQEGRHSAWEEPAPPQCPSNGFLCAGADDKRGHQLHVCRGVPGKARRWQSMSRLWTMLRPVFRRG